MCLSRLRVQLCIELYKSYCTVYTLTLFSFLDSPVGGWVELCPPTTTSLSGSCKVTNLARHPRAPDLPDLELDLSSTRVLIYPLSVGPCRAVSPARRVAALALAPSALHIYPMWWCPPSFGALSLSSLSFPARSASRAAALVRAGSCLPAPSVHLCFLHCNLCLAGSHWRAMCVCVQRAQSVRARPCSAEQGPKYLIRINI